MNLRKHAITAALVVASPFVATAAGRGFYFVLRWWNRDVLGFAAPQTVGIGDVETMFAVMVGFAVCAALLALAAARAIPK